MSERYGTHHRWLATTFAALAQKWNGHGREKNEIKSAQMYCEIELGQRIPPQEWDDLSKPPHTVTIPQQRISDFRRYCGHRDFLVEQVREGKRSRRALLLAVDRLEASQRDDPTHEDLDIRKANDHARRLSMPPMVCSTYGKASDHASEGNVVTSANVAVPGICQGSSRRCYVRYVRCSQTIMEPRALPRSTPQHVKIN